MRRRQPLVGWPEAIELVVLAIHAGASPLTAIASTGRRLDATGRHDDRRIGAAFGEVVHRVHRGSSLADALQALPELLGPAATEFADSIATADRYGLPLGPVLERLAAEARSERRRRAEADARALPVKLSFPLVVCTLPSFVLLAIVPAVLGAISTLRDSVP
ncbi:MAG: type II secretion system F family protein [Acidimicrobiia bacterium]